MVCVVPRIEFSKRTKLEAWRRCGGQCEICTTKLMQGDIHYDHINPVEMSSDASLDNCQVLCRACHKAKTQGDIRDIAKSNRLRNKAAGIKKSSRPMPGSRRSGWKKKMNGEVVRR